jgi:hypothetical protein
MYLLGKSLQLDGERGCSVHTYISEGGGENEIARERLGMYSDFPSLPVKAAPCRVCPVQDAGGEDPARKSARELLPSRRTAIYVRRDPAFRRPLRIAPSWVRGDGPSAQLVHTTHEYIYTYIYTVDQSASQPRFHTRRLSPDVAGSHVW